MFAQAALGGYSVVQWAIFIVLFAAVAALVMLALNKFGVQIPPWVLQVFWIVVVAVVIIMAIVFLAHVAGVR